MPPATGMSASSWRSPTLSSSPSGAVGRGRGHCFLPAAYRGGTSSDLGKISAAENKISRPEKKTSAAEIFSPVGEKSPPARKIPSIYPLSSAKSLILHPNTVLRAPFSSWGDAFPAAAAEKCTCRISPGTSARLFNQSIFIWTTHLYTFSTSFSTFLRR